MKVSKRNVYIGFRCSKSVEEAHIDVGDRFPTWDEILAVRYAIWGEQEKVYFTYNPVLAAAKSTLAMMLSHDPREMDNSSCLMPLLAREVQICCDNGLPLITYKESDEINKELVMVMKYTGLSLEAVKRLRSMAECGSALSSIKDVLWLLESPYLGRIAQHIHRLFIDCIGEKAKQEET